MTIKNMFVLLLTVFVAGCVKIGGEKPLVDLGNSSAPPAKTSQAPATLDDCSEQLQRWQSAYQSLNDKYEKLKVKADLLEDENEKLRDKLDD